MTLIHELHAQLGVARGGVPIIDPHSGNLVDTAVVSSALFDKATAFDAAVAPTPVGSVRDVVLLDVAD